MSQPPTPPPPHARIMQMATGHFLAPTGSDPHSLHRFLRTLTNFEIVTMNEDGRIAVTSLGEALKSDAPGCARSAVLTMGGPVAWKLWEQFEYSTSDARRARLAESKGGR